MVTTYDSPLAGGPFGHMPTCLQTVFGKQDPLKRYFILEDTKPAIFGSYAYDPINQVFETLNTQGQSNQTGYTTMSTATTAMTTTTTVQTTNVDETYLLRNKHGEYRNTYPTIKVRFTRWDDSKRTLLKLTTMKPN